MRRAPVRAVLAPLLALMLAFTILPRSEPAEASSSTRFRDVPRGHTFEADIAWIASKGITRGCGDGSRFCPNAPVTRGEMAAFLSRALKLPDAKRAGFRDVPRNHTFARDIDRLAASGITKGCQGGTRFCPSGNVTRAEMAAFLARGLNLPAAKSAGFRDVPRNHTFARDIDRLAASGITKGCQGGTRFCPNAPVTRGEMAAFLRRGLNTPAAKKPPATSGSGSGSTSGGSGSSSGSGSGTGSGTGSGSSGGSTGSGGSSGSGGSGGTTSPAPSGWRLVWSDEFDGGSLNSSVWRAYHNTYGDGNHELQCYTPDNVRVSGGTLKFTARREAITCPGNRPREFTSGFLGTRENQVYFPRYGRFEMRARLPHGQGLWPAFWLRHRNGASTAEVDIMEYFHPQVPGRTNATLHLDGRSNISKERVAFETPTTSPGWHTWAVDIEPVSSGVRFTFSLNGKAYHSYTDTQHNWASSAPADATWDIAVNLSVGGRGVGHPDDPLGYLRDQDRCAKWNDDAASPDGCDSDGVLRTSFPTTMEVDYIRFYQRD